MSNMAYCRFENTAGALRDCLDALNDGASPDSLGSDEARACRRLIRMCQEIAENYGDLADES